MIEVPTALFVVLCVLSGLFVLMVAFACISMVMAAAQDGRADDD